MERKYIIELESDAFRKFDDGMTPKDLVKEGFCTSEEAIELYKLYCKTVSTVVPLGDMDTYKLNDIAEKIDLLGSRIAQLELQLMNSMLLPKKNTCGACGHKGPYGVGIICEKCNEVGAYTQEDMDGVVSSLGDLEPFRPWEDEDED